ncbi:MAG: hypothetical protein R3B68_14740 [Phycisphaerales bacterium]
MRILAAVAASIALTGLARAQPSAVVVTTLTDPLAGTPVSAIAPGQTVRMRTTVSWEPLGTQMAGIAGDMLVTPLTPGGGVGASSNRVSEYTPGVLVNLGAFSGDDVVGIDIAVTPAFFTGGFLTPPTWNADGIDFIGFDWTAPSEPGDYEFRFQPKAAAPNFRAYLHPASPLFSEIATTYIGAIITVTPAPSVGTVGVFSLVVLATRRQPR